MHPLSPKELKSFQDEYLQSKRKQYVEFFRYIIIVVSSPLVAESCRALLELKFFLLLSLVIGGFVAGLVIYYIWNLKTNQEYGITAYFVAFCAFVLVINYNDPTGYFIDPKNSFYFGYGICSCERQIMSKIPNMRLRIMFRLAIFVASFLVVTPNQISLFMMQSVHAISGIYFDLDDEKRDKKLFKAYFSSKDQLVQFKDFVVRDIPASILVVTPDITKCLFSNNSFQQKFGKESLKVLLEQIKVEDTNSNDSTSLQSLSSQGSHSQNFFQFLQSNITEQRLSCSLIYNNTETKDQHIFTAKVVQIIWDDQPAIAIILQDITEQHTILTLKAADAQKDALMATVSHELRTPLNGMLGLIQILQQRITDKQLLHYVNICKNSGNLLAALVNSILDLNQIRASTIRLYPEKVNLKELLNDIVHLFEVQCAQKNIFLHYKLSETPSTNMIYTDRNRLSQILINLIGNALKFTSKGGITIIINQSKESLQHLEFKVLDTGLGIKSEDQEKLFKMFGKLEQTDRKVNREGIGLGLTISNNLAKLLCEDQDLGGIKLESKYGEGSCFTWLIKKNLLTETPLLNSPKRKSSPQENISHKINTYQFPQIKTFSETESCNTSLVRCKTSPNQDHTLLLASPISQKKSVSAAVLIADDNPLNLTVAEYLVSSKGYKVKTALSGTEAIKILLQNNLNIKLIFMDLQMPEMNGYETAKNLSKLMEEGKISNIPIVALTANDSQKERNACLKVGMKDYLSKPLRDKELSAILNTYLVV